MQLRRRLILTAAIAVLSAELAEAAPVVRIVQQVCRNGTCKRTWASGTVIGRDRSTGKLAVLTCAHGHQANVPYLVEIEAGQPFEEGRLKSIDPADDLALLLVAHPGRTRIIPIGDTQPQPGQRVIVGGFKLAKTEVPRETPVKKYSADTFDVAETFSQGESGGPAVFNDSLVGVIRGNGLATDRFGNAPSPLLTDGTLTCLSRIRRFVNDGLGGIPEPKKVEGVEEVKESKGSHKVASAPAPTADQLSPSTSSTPLTSATASSLKADVVEGIKAELPKILSEHLGPVEERLHAGIKAHGLVLAKTPQDVKDAIVPELPAIGRQVLADALPALQGALASAIPGILPTILAVAGGIAVPGAGALAIAGWLVSRALGKHTSVLTAIAGHLGRQRGAKRQAPANEHSQGLGGGCGTQTRPESGLPLHDVQTVSTPVAPETINTSVAQIVTEIGTEAYQRMKGDLIKKNPGLANDGTIKLMDSLFTQHLSGLKPHSVQ